MSRSASRPKAAAAELFRDRRFHYCGAVIEATRQYAEQSGRGTEDMEQMDELRRYVKERFEDDLRRGLGTHLLLTIVTLGIYGFVWDYQLHTDPEKMYPEVHSTEDTVLTALRHAEATPHGGLAAA